MTIADTLTSKLEPHFKKKEWPSITPILKRLERNRAIRKEVDRLREEEGFTLADACQEVADNLPHDFTAASVESIYYWTR